MPAEPPEFIDAEQEEIQRQARLKLQRQAALLQQAAEEEERRKVLEAELQYASIIRRQRENREREIEEEKERERENRKRVGKEKRMAEAKKLQEWREEQAKRSEQRAAFKAESRRRRDEERRKRILSSQSNPNAYEELFSGWVTLQNGDSLMSRRRFCSVRSGGLKFFKDASVSLILILFQE